MPDDHKPSSYRLKLGPVVTEVLEDLPEQTAAALDDHVQHLLTTAARATALEEERQLFRANTSTLSGHVGTLSQALTHLSTCVSNNMDMVDHRTREIQKLMLHIGTLLGSSTTEGAEREHYHVRFGEVFRDLSKQMESLSGLVKEHQRMRERFVKSSVDRAEEDRLSIADQVHPNLDSRAEKTRGMER